MTDRRVHWGLAAMVIATLLWGGTFVVIRDTVAQVDPVSLVFARFLAATFLLAPFAIARRGPRTRQAVGGGVVAGVFMALGYLFQAIGLTATSAGSSAFLTSAGQLFTGFLAWPLLGLRPSMTLVAGIAVAMVGCVMIGSGRGWGMGPGEVWTLLGSFSFAVQIVAIARVAARVDPIGLAALQSVTITAVLVPFSGHTGAVLRALDAQGLWRLGYLIVAGSALAPVLQILAQRVLPPGRVGLLFALEPVFALAFALTLGGERFVLPWWLGAGLILLAVTSVELRASRSEAQARP